MVSRASLSMLVTLEERERLKELSRWSNGLAPRGGHTDRRTVRGEKQREVKHPQAVAGGRQTRQTWTRSETKPQEEFCVLNLKVNNCKIRKCPLCRQLKLCNALLWCCQYISDDSKETLEGTKKIVKIVSVCC